MTKTIAGFSVQLKNVQRPTEIRQKHKLAAKISTLLRQVSISHHHSIQINNGTAMKLSELVYTFAKSMSIFISAHLRTKLDFQRIEYGKISAKNIIYLTIKWKLLVQNR